jgi:hypothetical protein
VQSILNITSEILEMYEIPWVDQKITVRALERYSACDKKIDTQALKQFDIKPYIRSLLQSPHKKDQLLWIDLLVNLDDETYLSAESIIFQSPFSAVWYYRFFYLYEKNIWWDFMRFEKQRFLLGKQLLESELKEEQEIGIKLIGSKISKSWCIDKALSSNFPKIVLKALTKWNDMGYVIKRERKNKIYSRADALLKKEQSKENQIIWAKLIQYVPKKMMLELLLKAIDMPYPEIRDICKWHSQWLINKQYEMFAKIMSKKAWRLLNSENVSDQLLWSNYVNFLNQEESSAVDLTVFIEVWIVTKWELSENTINKLLTLHHEVIKKLMPKLQLFDYMKGDYKDTGLEYIQPPIYKKDFVKRGWAELTINNNALMWKTIVRHFPPEQFLAWKKLYEDHALWKEHWFDYVPIEPIQAFYQRESWLIDVYAGVLDCNLNTRVNEYLNWIRVRELYNDREKIQDIFNKIRFSHGHNSGNPWMNNCVLRFRRTEEGGVDFTKKPRIYVIDFDQAKFIHNDSQNNT